MKTKEKIIKESLNLFNENTFELSTTNLIAKKSDVLEGSLWYHFNTKPDIVSVHLGMFIDLYDEHKNLTTKNNPTIFIQGLFAIYGIIWDYRYLFRDSFEKIIDKKPSLSEKIIDINSSIDQWVKEFVMHAQKIGILIIDESDVESITEISLIIGRCWFDFSKKRYPDKSNMFLKKKGINLLIKSFYPYLTKESKSLIDSMYDSN
ncbi:MAG: TetR family transcriptional regulator [Flavobacteriales bacterium]|nr:TetR family transcriptional regulator [Flavobacteriales bacterium]|tara:strand:+ start:3643 stop:4257 length:615 start_codon:yes stop_codon:yes gene_type:complete